MFRPLLLAASCLVLSAWAAGPDRAPVLVELFTSEGCSSCPPADSLLQRLDPQAMVLSEHVDYWNQLGWKDRFSSPAYTDRQQNYARTFGIDGPYTPQMVVDGAAEFNGSDSRRAAVEIGKAAGRPKARIRLARIASGIQVEISAPPNSADAFLALADDADSTHVAGGENQGRDLHHVAVLRSLRKIGSLQSGGTFARTVDLPAAAARQRVVVFLQESAQGRVLGAALLPSSL